MGMACHNMPLQNILLRKGAFINYDLGGWQVSRSNTLKKKCNLTLKYPKKKVTPPMQLDI